MKGRPKYKEGDFPEPGSVFVAPTADGRLTVGRVLRRQTQGGDSSALIAGSPWLGTAPPTLDLPEVRETLVLTHHAWGAPGRWGEHRNLLWAINLMPSDFRLIGAIDLSRDERSITCNSYGGWESIPLQALLQWRWDHDRENLLREEAEEEAREEERRRLAEERRAEFMRTLTLESLTRREWLETWDEERTSTRATRELLAKLVADLCSLPKPTKAAVSKLLKACVRELNRLDKQSQFIDTLEREDLYEAFEHILCAARHPTLVGQIDNWRDW